MHRSCLSWLKEWDLCVFKADKKKMNAAGLIKKERRNRDGFNGKRKWDAGGGSGGGFEEQVRLKFLCFSQTSNVLLSKENQI